jgi:hypothetical protein
MTSVLNLDLRLKLVMPTTLTIYLSNGTVILSIFCHSSIIYLIKFLSTDTYLV